MATYFHGAPEIQTDGLQTLYLMNPGYGGYSADAAAAAASTNMVFLNSAVATLNPAGISHHQQQQHFVGIPLQPQVAAPAQDPDSSRPMSIHDMSAATGVHGLLPRLQNNLWSPNPANSLGNLTSPLGLRRPSELLSGQQGLSLSLSPQQPSYMYRLEPEMQPPAPPVISPTGEEAVRFSTSTSSAASGATSNGVPALQSVLMGSKYLKAAQQLLDEVVSVGKGVKDHESPKSAKTSPTKAGKGAEEDGGDDANGKRAVAELTTAERQELQMKKAKLVNMLDEVEQRYRQYHHQMQIVISSFEAIAGVGSARTYTALALRTISKQFRCLRDAITGQIRATSKNMGEDDCLVGSRSEGGSRLRFVDHHLRQQRALQQLGMMQHNAWRPQRGLPERSVFVLRAWLFEHFLHPYPKDADKHMLAKQTGLTRNQVSNWFINARVRLWKPMVEEMYLEETKEHEQQQNNGEDKASTSEAANDDSSSKSSAPPPNGSPTRTEQSEDFKARQDHLQTDHSQPPAGVAMPSPSSTSIRFPPHFYHDHSNTDDMIQFNLKRQRSNASDPVNHHQTSMTLPMTLEMDLKPEDTSNSELFMRFGDIMRAGDEQSFSLLTPGENNGAYAAYPMGDIGQFAPRYGGNGVSLTLGLPQGSYLSSDTIAMGRRLEMSTEANDYFSSNNDSNNGNNSNHTPPVSHSPNAYDNLSIQNRKRFPAQLLPDFVA